MIRPEEALVYLPQPVDRNELSEFTVDPIRARVSTDKAKRLLGFGTIVPRERAMQLTLAWAQHARILPGAVREEIGVAR